MAFQTFNQGAVQSAYIGYKSYLDTDFINDELTLYWANAGALLPTNQLMAQFLDIKPLSAGKMVNIPPAEQVGIGTNFIVYNSGEYDLEIYDQENNDQVMATIPAGQTVYFILKTYELNYPLSRWQAFNFASTTGTPIVASLAGYGLQTNVDENNLMVTMEIDTITDPVGVEIKKNDRAFFYVWTVGSGPFNLKASTLIDGWFCSLTNLGTGQITIQPESGLIDGQTSKELSLKQSLTIVSDGTNYFTLGYGQQQTNITIPLSILNGGTGASTAESAIKNLMPQANTDGQMVYYDGDQWEILDLPSTPGTQVLTNNTAGDLAWQYRYPLPAPGTDGNLLISSGGQWIPLPASPNGSILLASGGQWTPLAASNGSLLISSGGTWTHLAPTNGSLLFASGGTWAPLSATPDGNLLISSGGSWSKLGGGADGNLLVSSGGQWIILPPGINGKTLKIVGGVPAWA